MIVRRDYKIETIHINGRSINKVVIDPHIDKHSDHIDDELVLSIVKKLDGEDVTAVNRKGAFSYFATELCYEKCWYKLVWLLEDEEIYIGVITLYKDRRIK